MTFLSKNLFGQINPANTDLPSQLERTLGDPRVLLSSGLAAFGSGAAAHILNNREAPRMGETPSQRRSRQLKNVLLAAVTGGAVIPGAALGVNALNDAQPGSSPAARGLANAEVVGGTALGGGLIGKGVQTWNRSRPTYKTEINATINDLLGRDRPAGTPIPTYSNTTLKNTPGIFDRLKVNLRDTNLSDELPPPGWKGVLGRTVNRFIGRTSTTEEEAAALMRSIGAAAPGDSWLSRINPLSSEYAMARNAPEAGVLGSIGPRSGMLSALGVGYLGDAAMKAYDQYRDTTN